VGAAAATGLWLSRAAEDDYLASATLLATGVACSLVAAALVLRRPVTIPFALAVLVAPYVAMLAFEVDALDERAPVLAGALLATSELAYWSLELRAPLADEPGTYLRRISLLALLVLGTVVGGTAILALVAGVGARGTAIDVAGAVAALGAVALLVVVASRRAG
jgi:hypothetical protein